MCFFESLDMGTFLRVATRFDGNPYLSTLDFSHCQMDFLVAIYRILGPGNRGLMAFGRATKLSRPSQPLLIRYVD